MYSVERAPVAAVAGCQSSGYEEDEIHKPPDSQASKSEEFSDGGARVAQAKAVHAKAAQEERVQERSDEVVTGVSVDTSQIIYTGHIRVANFTLIQDQLLILFL